MRFKNKESAKWVLNKYDTQTVNGRQLKVSIDAKNQHRPKRFMPLLTINETQADGDEDLGSDASNNSG